MKKISDYEWLKRWRQARINSMHRMIKRARQRADGLKRGTIRPRDNKASEIHDLLEYAEMIEKSLELRSYFYPLRLFYPRNINH